MKTDKQKTYMQKKVDKDHVIRGRYATLSYMRGIHAMRLFKTRTVRDADYQWALRELKEQDG